MSRDQTAHARHLHMLDSGAFTFFNKHNSSFNSFCNKKAKNRVERIKPDFSYADTKEFWEYVDSYANFVKQWKDSIDYYVNVDVVLNPKKSWEVLKYLEQEHGLHPIPVVHFGTSIKWVEKYINRGYTYIGMGGRIGHNPYFPWADKVWSVICATPDRKPCCKVHGFALTTHKHITRYPWFSCDSTTWKKMGIFGQIVIPRKRSGEFCWWEPYKSLFVDFISPYTKRVNRGGKHFLHLTRFEQHQVREWLEYIKVPFGKMKPSGKVTEIGVTNCKQERVAANLRYFLWLQSKLPQWPWSWEPPIHRESLERLLL